MNNLDSLQYFLPEIVLVGGVLFIILFDLVTSRREFIPYITLWILAVAFFISANMLSPVIDGMLFEGLIRLNGFTVFFKLLFSVATFLTVLFSIARHKEHQGIEYYSLLLISTLGLFLLSSANDLLMVYIGLEAVSISSYLLVASQKGILKSSEAGLKYVIYGAIASGIMLYGISLLYGLSGTTSLNDLFNVIARSVATKQSQIGGIASPSGLAMTGGGVLIFSVSLFMVFVGLGYKIAAVPVHMWCPDIYEGAPTEITAFLSIAPKAAGFAIIIRFFSYGLLDLGSLQSVRPAVVPQGGMEAGWQTIFALISVLTMTIGNLAALHQTNLKRLLAYSSIAHAGYILMGLVILNESGIQAILLYLPIYLFMNMGAFFVVYIIERATGKVDITEYEGLGWRLPFIGVIMSIFLFSLVGLPPLGGFIAKLYLFAAVINGKWYLLAIIGVLNGVISLFYYTRIVRAMFLRNGSGVPIISGKMPQDDSKPPAAGVTLRPEFIPVGLYDSALLLLLVFPVIILGVYWSPLLEIINRTLNI